MNRLVILLVTLSIGCKSRNKGGGFTPWEPGDTEEDPGSGDGDAPDPVEPGEDGDGDGVADGEDCAPEDPSAWENVVWSGELEGDDVPGICDGLCSRVVTDNVTVAFTALEDLGDLSCMRTIGGDVTISGTGP